MLTLLSLHSYFTEHAALTWYIHQLIIDSIPWGTVYYGYSKS